MQRFELIVNRPMTGAPTVIEAVTFYRSPIALMTCLGY